MERKALLLYENKLSSTDRNVYKLLEFFGIPFQGLKYDKLSKSEYGQNDIKDHEYCILGSAPAIAKAAGLRESNLQLQHLIKAAHSVYIYEIETSLLCNQLLRFITGDPSSEIIPLKASGCSLSVNKEYSDFCGSMAGLSIPMVPTDSDFAFRISRYGERIKRLISSENLDVYLKAIKDEVPFFLNACSNVIDITSPVTKGFFDIKDHFMNAVPLVMYLSWAFRDVCWKSHSVGACLIVDDPLLRPKYGFFDFKRVLDVMDSEGFSTNISFIPLNWKRSNPIVADLFRRHPEKYSLSIHGCDHVSNEFGAKSINALNKRVKLAKKRMELHRQITRCNHDPVMVFPQGVFSDKSLEVLKHNNFLAAVNTEVSPVNCDNRTEISELWDLAIMKYGSFPVFTRRYPEHGIENFAFDIMMGKPCLVVTHHNFFRNDCRELIEFIRMLNALQCKLRWQGLAEVIKSSFKERPDVSRGISVRMYGNSMSIANTDSEVKTYNIYKKENDPSHLKAVMVNGDTVTWEYDGTHLNFKVNIPPKKQCSVSIEYRDVYGESSFKFNMGYKVKSRMRRYLSEIRDNYLSKNESLSRYASRLKRFI